MRSNARSLFLHSTPVLERPWERLAQVQVPSRITTNQLQHRETIRGRLKFDKSANYTWNFGVFTGTRFTSGWDNTGLGLADTQKNFAFKASYFSAIPIPGVEAQYGGFYILKGESSELTTSFLL